MFSVQAVVLESIRTLRVRDIEIAEKLGAHDVRVRIHTVGVCGSDVHYYQHGAIGPFVEREPMVLGHEAAGVVEAVGSAVTSLRVDDRVCMEPGVPDPNSRATRLGLYNLDPAMRFWATPPVHGCLRPTVVHPAAFTFRLPDNVSFSEGAITPVNIRDENLTELVRRATGGWGADVVFDAVGLLSSFTQAIEVLCPGGCVVLIGVPGAPVAFDVVAAQVKEARIETISATPMSIRARSPCSAAASSTCAH